MNRLSSWLNILQCQKGIVSHKLKIYGIGKKIEDNYRMIGEEVYLFSQKPKSHKSILSQGRVKFLLNEVNKEHEIIAETEKEIFELKEKMIAPTAQLTETTPVETDGDVSEVVEHTDSSQEEKDIK